LLQARSKLAWNASGFVGLLTVTLDKIVILHFLAVHSYDKTEGIPVHRDTVRATFSGGKETVKDLEANLDFTCRSRAMTPRRGVPSTANGCAARSLLTQATILAQ